MSNVTLTPAVGALAASAGAAAIWPSSGYLYLTEFASPSEHPLAGGYPHAPSLADQVVPFGGISAVSAAFGPSTRLVRVHSDSTCTVKVGGQRPIAGVKLGGTARMVAGVTEYYGVVPGDRLAVITAS